MKCYMCGAEMKIVNGWESKDALECPTCGEYAYFVGNILCGRTFDKNKRPDENEIRQVILFLVGESMSEKFTKKDWVEVLKILGYPILLIVGLLLGLMM